MTIDEFESKIDDLSLMEDYQSFLTEAADGTRWICNGDDLVNAWEDEYRFDEFREWLVA